MQDDTIVKTVFINASADTVWQYLTNKDKLGEWFHPAMADLAEGQEYTLYDQHNESDDCGKCWGVVQEAEHARKLVYTFTFEHLGGAPTTVTWTLSELHGGTRLTLLHAGISAAAGEAALPLLMDLDVGWDQHLGRLRSVAD